MFVDVKNRKGVPHNRTALLMKVKLAYRHGMASIRKLFRMLGGPQAQRIPMAAQFPSPFFLFHDILIDGMNE